MDFLIDLFEIQWEIYEKVKDKIVNKSHLINKYINTIQKVSKNIQKKSINKNRIRIFKIRWIKFGI